MSERAQDPPRILNPNAGQWMRYKAFEEGYPTAEQRARMDRSEERRIIRGHRSSCASLWQDKPSRGKGEAAAKFPVHDPPGVVTPAEVVRVFWDWEQMPRTMARLYESDTR